MIDLAQKALTEIEAAGTMKRERSLHSPQSSRIVTPGPAGDREVINFCANNYLGLANDPRLIDAAKRALDSHGVGMASVRFICGTQNLHQVLEVKTAAYLGMEDCIVFPSCFDANGGVFELCSMRVTPSYLTRLIMHPLLMGYACARRSVSAMPTTTWPIRTTATKAGDYRTRLIVTDGVFSMDGIGLCRASGWQKNTTRP